MQRSKRVTQVNFIQLVLVSTIMIFTLGGCSDKTDQNGGSISTDTLSAPLPNEIRALALDETLVVEIIEEGTGARRICSNLSVDLVNGTFSCSITLSGGPHTISLVFSINSSIYGILQIATTSTIDVDITPGQTSPANFITTALSYFDDDGDGISNADELTEGSDPTEMSFYVGGVTSGLIGSGAVLQLNAGNGLSLKLDDSFKFVPALSNNATYSVTVLSQPSNPNQVCTLNNDSGSVSDANIVDVSVTCVTVAYPIGGKVTGLTGTGLVLQNNSTDDLAIDTVGSFDFAFATALADGSSFTVTVLTQPSMPEQFCSVTSGNSTVSGADVTTVLVTCSTQSFNIGVNVIELIGNGLVVQNNGTDNLTINTDGVFTFATALADGSPYSISVFTQPLNPSQTCSVTNGSGTINGSNVVDSQITCSCIIGMSRIGRCTLE